MKKPKVWSLEQLKADVDESAAVFRRERLDEPLEKYSQFFGEFSKAMKPLLATISDLSSDSYHEAIRELVTNEKKRTILRYLAAPPISEDDLKTLAETTLSPKALGQDADKAARIRNIILQIIDPHRFPWVGKKRKPTNQERDVAIVSSAAMIAAKKVETVRRRSSSQTQELLVGKVLRAHGLEEVSVASRRISRLSEAPGPGRFCRECRLGDTKADLIVGLLDQRIMPIECKVSNSAVNSFKRVNHEALGKARAWLRFYGERQIVPVAVLSGVFNPNNLTSAQDENLFLVWAHRISDLSDFVVSTRTHS